MGVTLPLLVKALARRPGDFGRALGGLYGSNTLGACLGALAGETLCIAPLGLAGTGLLAAGLNFAAAAGALFLAPRFRDFPSATETPTPPKAQSALTGRARRLLGAGFLAGGAFLALEVVWTRFLQLFVRSTNLAFAVMLAVILAGIGLGGLWAGWWLAREADGRKLAAPLSLAVAVAGLASFTVLGPMGCQMNVADGDWLRRSLLALGFTEAPAHEADIFIVLTCSVREKPELKVASELGRLAEFQRHKPAAFVAVGGCVAQQIGPALWHRFPMLVTD